MGEIVEANGVSAGGTATYVYCVLRSGRTPAFRRPPKGLDGMGRPRLLALAQGLWLIAADAPLKRYGGEPIERKLGDLDWISRCAVAHEAVVEHASQDGVVIPVKLFTLFASDERALMHFARTRKRLERLIDRVAGRDEWGVQVSVDQRLALKDRLDGRSGADGLRSGTEFLLRKKRDQEIRTRVVADTARQAERIFDALSRFSDDERRRTPAQSGGSVRSVLDATFLVPSRRARPFKEAVGALTEELRPRGYRIRLTGPWPPYTFVANKA